MDTAPWPQANSSDPRHLVNEMGLVMTPSQLEDMVPSGPAAAACSSRPPQLMERKPRPQREQALSCPRCQSTNTKFCYYNNYSLTQPRYFCKTCRRYWTEGGSLRNVPVGGGSRKNKRPSSSSTVTTSKTASTTPTSSLSSSATSTTSRKLPSDHLAPPPPFQQNPNKFHEGQDLNLAFPPQHHMNGTLLGDQFPTVESSSINAATNPPTCSSAATSSSISAMELLRSGLSAPFMPMMAAAEAGVAYPSSVFGLQDFRPTTTTTTSLSFSLDGIGGGGYGSVQGVQEGTGGRVFFPYEDLRQVSSTTPAHEIIEQNRVQGTGDPSGFWNGVMGGGAAGSW